MSLDLAFGHCPCFLYIHLSSKRIRNPNLVFCKTEMNRTPKNQDQLQLSLRTWWQFFCWTRVHKKLIGSSRYLQQSTCCHPPSQIMSSSIIWLCPEHQNSINQKKCPPPPWQQTSISQIMAETLDPGCGLTWGHWDIAQWSMSGVIAG